MKRFTLGLRRIWNQVRKELAQFRRDRLTVALAYVLPLVTLLIFGFAIRLEVKDIPLAIQDWSNTPLSRAYISRLFATNQFEPVAWSGNNPITDALDPGRAKAAVIIPPDFASQVRDRQSVAVQVLIDGTDPNNARVIRNSIQATTRFFLQEQGLLSDQPAVAARIRLWFNPGREEALYIVPGVYALVLWTYPSILAAIAMAREKEQGTIVQAYASTLSAVEFLLGKALAYLLVALSEAVLVMGSGTLLFGLWFAGDPTPFLVGTPLFLLLGVLFGLLIGSRAINQTAAVQVVAILGFLTTLLLSGFIYPLSNIPVPLSWLANVIPSRYYIAIARDAFVRGGGWPGVWWCVLFLVGLGLLLFNAARRVLLRMQLPD